ncbi:tetratricopeptide repeat protein [Nesterenkonia populi]
MTNQPAGPAGASVNARGAVDLSALSGQQAPAQQQPAAQRSADGGPGRDSWAIAVQPQELQQVLQLSSQAPVLVLIHGEDPTSQQFRDALTRAVDSKAGRAVLATIDAAANPQLAQQAGQLPVVTAFLGGQPVGEFDSSAPAEQLPQVVDQILQMATQNGITGTVPAQSRQSDGEEGQEQELPPLHQKAHEALEQGDLDGAVSAYEQALKESPGDDDAKLGIAQVKLMQRTQDADLAAVRQQAADQPDSAEAQTAVADMDVLGGHVEDAFARLIRFIQTHPGEERETARKHLVELYSIVGDDDPRVAKSRRDLARALF